MRWQAPIEEYRARGIGEAYITHVERELERWGASLKRRRPHLEAIPVELHVRYLQERTAFRTKATVYGVLSKMRGFGDYLVAQGVWAENPLKWLQGPKVTPYHRMPKRIDAADMKALWLAAAAGRGVYQRHLSITILSILYGTGLRRGELERLNVSDWNREDGSLRIDGRKTGQERCVPVPRIVYHCLETYLPHRQNHLLKTARLDEPALFLNRQGGRFKANLVSLLVRSVAQRANVTLHSVYQFRHTCASDLLAAGVALPDELRQKVTAATSWLRRAAHTTRSRVRHVSASGRLRSAGREGTCRLGRTTQLLLIAAVHPVQCRHRGAYLSCRWPPALRAAESEGSDRPVRNATPVELFQREHAPSVAVVASRGDAMRVLVGLAWRVQANRVHASDSMHCGPSFRTLLT